MAGGSGDRAPGKRGGLRLRVPPGRAGRMWLDRRLAAARRGADLLDRKLRILQGELGALQDAAARTERQWRASSAEADRSLLIAALLGGQRAARLAASAGRSEVSVDYTVTVGVRHPAGGSCRPPPGDAPWAGQPAELARQAHQVALAAAVNHAAAAEAVRLIAAEAAATRYRLRAIRDRLVPSLEQARGQVALAIEELERADGARLRVFGGVGRAGGPAVRGP
jgi:V/A-type H+/Na+-transporting ATPase subunit D